MLPPPRPQNNPPRDPQVWGTPIFTPPTPRYWGPPHFQRLETPKLPPRGPPKPPQELSIPPMRVGGGFWGDFRRFWGVWGGSLTICSPAGNFRGAERIPPAPPKPGTGGGPGGTGGTWREPGGVRDPLSPQKKPSESQRHHPPKKKPSKLTRPPGAPPGPRPEGSRGARGPPEGLRGEGRGQSSAPTSQTPPNPPPKPPKSAQILPPPPLPQAPSALGAAMTRGGHAPSVSARFLGHAPSPYME